MYVLCKTCPTCGSANVEGYKNTYNLLPIQTAPYIICKRCRTLWGTGRPPFRIWHKYK